MKMKQCVLLLFLGLCIGTLLWVNLDVRALATNTKKSSEQTTEEQVEAKTGEVMNQLDTGEIDSALRDLFPRSEVDFSDCVSFLLKGDMKGCTETIKKLLAQRLVGDIGTQKTGLVHILILIIAAAVFTNFSRVFANKQVSDICFFMVYLILLVVCMRSFDLLLDQIENTLHHCTLFVSALCPVYFLVVAMGTGVHSATVFYEMILFMIYLFQIVIIGLLLPLIHVYMILQLLNYLSIREELSRFAEVLKISIQWILKGFLTLVIGMSTIQGLIAPALDQVGRSIVGRSVEAVPVFGDGISGIGEVTMGSVVLIKNGIGAAGMLICLCICLGPLIQLVILTLVYKLIAAVTEPISDKRISGCVASVGDGCQVLMQVVYTMGILFIVTLAIVSATTS